MTVINNDARDQYVATNLQTVFSYTFEIADESDIQVFQRGSTDSPNDADDLLTLTTEYTVTGVGSGSGGTIVLVSGATTGDIITLQGNAPAERTSSFNPGGTIQAANLNTQFDQDILIYQSILATLNFLTPKYPKSAIVNDFDTILPLLSPGESWVMNGSGDEIIAAVAGGDSSNILAQLASHDPGDGASLIGLSPTGTVQDLANAKFILQTANSAAPNAQSLGLLSTGILKNTTSTGVLSISAPLTSIDGLTTVADKMLYTTGANTYATTDLSPFARTVLDDTTAAAMAATLLVLPLAGGTMAGTLNMGTHFITNVIDPVNPQDAATKNYADNVLSSGFLPLSGGTMSGQINMGNNKIVGLADPTVNQDAVTLFHLNTQLALKLSLSGGTMTGAINMNSHYITGLLDPVNPQDAATRAYVDLVATGLTVQAACRLATTGALTATYANGASGIGATLTNAGAMAALSLDGTAAATNDSVLIKDQAAPLQNGIYTVTNIGSGAVNWVLTRRADYDQPSEIAPGDLVVITAGSTLAGTSFIETDTVTAVGTDPIEFSQFTFSATAVLLKANNLSDVSSVTTAFNNISPSTTKGDLIVNDGTNDIRLGVGSDGALLQANPGTASGLQYTTATYPTTTTINQILYSSAANTITGLATVNGGVLVTSNTGVPSMLANPGAAGRMLQSGNAAIASWSTPTYPSGSGTTGQIVRSDGTNNVYSTATFADTYAVSRLLYASASNVVTGLATGNSGVLVTDATGVPAWSGTMTNGQIIIGSTGATPVAASLTPGAGIVITPGAGTLTISAPGGGVAWANIAGTTQAAAVDSGYVIGNAAQTTVTLPATAALGSTVLVQGKGAGGWILTANTGQTIQIGSSVTTTAGSLTSTNQWDSVEVVCVTADTVWSVTRVFSTGLTIT